MTIRNLREGLRRYPFVKCNGTKDIAESPTRPFWEGHAQINKIDKISKQYSQFTVTVKNKEIINSLLFPLRGLGGKTN